MLKYTQKFVYAKEVTVADMETKYFRMGHSDYDVHLNRFVSVSVFDVCWQILTIANINVFAQ